MEITAWRVSAAKYVRPPYDPLDGEGARGLGGRWNSPGVPMVYLSATLSLAILEVLVNGQQLLSLLDKVAARLQFTDADVTAVEPRATGQLRPLAESQTFGNAWIAAKSSAVLRVPSVVIPQEFNYLMNPEHPDFPRIRATATKWGPLPIDRRLLETK